MSNIGLLLLRWRYGGYGCEDNLHLLNVQINVSYSNSVYELRQEASKMKTLIILLLFFSNSLLAQTASTDKSTRKQLNYIASNTNELFDENGNNIFNFTEQDSIVFNGEEGNNNFGRSVSIGGDINGDGFSDVIVGAYGKNSFTGKVYIFYGGVNMNNVADVTLTGESPNSYFGFSVSTAGDVNEDGYSDVIVGAHGYNSMTGKVYIFYGGINMNNVADVTMIGEGTINFFGYSVSTAGDVNNDGYSDVIVGTSRYSQNTGKAYVYLGSINMDNIVDITMTGANPNDFFGLPVSSSGDVNGDGFSDVIVGAYGVNSATGKVFIYYGGRNMDSVSDVTMTGEDVNNFFNNCASAGDVNGDGYSDVIVGAWGYNSKKGRAYIYYGGVNMNNVADIIMTGENINDAFGLSVSAAGDIDGDGYSDVIAGAYGFDSFTGKVYIFYGGANMNNIADVTMKGEGTNDFFGYSVSTAGDVNGDGYSDEIIGAYGNSSSKGRVYLYFDISPNPILIYPTNNSINNLLNINFIWKKYFSSLYYILNVSTDSIFSNVVVNDTIFNDTSKTVYGFQKGIKYFWKVKSIDTSGYINASYAWNFTTITPLYLNLKVLMEGLYYQLFNQMIRKDTVNVYLRNAASPYAVVDSAKGIIDSMSFSNIFSFINAPSGTYYIVVKHFNSIETWSKSGGETILIEGSNYNYDFTASASKAYGNNQKLKGGKYCIYGGNVNCDDLVDGSDLSLVDNDSYSALTGRFLRSDVNGNNIVDATDVSIVDNNSYNSILRITP